MQDALAHLKDEVLPKNPRMFAVMAEGPLAEIEKLRDAIEEQTRGYGLVANAPALRGFSSVVWWGLFGLGCLRFWALPHRRDEAGNHLVMLLLKTLLAASKV